MRLVKKLSFVSILILALFLSHGFARAQHNYIGEDEIVIEDISYKNIETEFQKILPSDEAIPYYPYDTEYFPQDQFPSLDGQTVYSTVICEDASQSKCFSIGTAKCIAIGEPVYGTSYNGVSLWQKVICNGKEYYAPYDNLTLNYHQIQDKNVYPLNNPSSLSADTNNTVSTNNQTVDIIAMMAKIYGVNLGNIEDVFRNYIYNSQEGTISYLRQTAVKLAWKLEQELLKATGRGTVRWTELQKIELLETGKVKGYQGHHINSIKNNPKLAPNPNNIQFVNNPEHFKLHNNNWKNPTKGNFINRVKISGGKIKDPIKVGKGIEIAGTGLKYLGRAAVIGAIVYDVYNISQAENKVKETTKVAGGWAGAYAGATVGAAACVWAAGVGAIPCGIIGGAIGYFVGENIGEAVYNNAEEIWNQNQQEVKN